MKKGSVYVNEHGKNFVKRRKISEDCVDNGEYSYTINSKRFMAALCLEQKYNYSTTNFKYIIDKICHKVRASQRKMRDKLELMEKNGDLLTKILEPLSDESMSMRILKAVLGAFSGAHYYDELRR